MNPVQRIFGRIREMLTTSSNAISHTLRVASVTWARRVRSALMQPTKDLGRPDYDWWRRAFYCRVQGLELSGLFLRPLVSKVSSWTLGMGLDWKTTNEATQTALNDWFGAHLPDLLQAMRASLKQGDSFAVINADLSVTLLPPDTVDPIVAEDDYSNIIGWRVTQVLAHPETLARRMTITDEYFIDQRIHTVVIDGRQTTTTYPNLLGRLPIVHIANAKDEGDTFGHPEAEALVELLLRYNTTLEAAIDGNERQGRPTPVMSFERVADLDKFWSDYGVRESRTLPDGTTEQVTTIGVDLTQILTVAGAEFQYAAPGSFTQDTSTLLGLMFYLLLEHAEIPEFIMGNAIASSQASANVQMPVFEKFIEGRRGEAAGWLVEIAGIVNAYQSLTIPGVSTAETPVIQWQKLTQDNKMTLDAVTWAYAEGLLDERTALMLAPVEIADIDAVLAAAKKERQERQAQEQQMLLDSQMDSQISDGGNNDGFTQNA